MNLRIKIHLFTMWLENSNICKQTLHSINTFILLLVMSYVGSRVKLLMMSWYKTIKPFTTRLKFVIKKHLCGMHDYFPGVNYYSNDVMFSVMSKYVCFYYLNKISLKLYIFYIFQALCLILKYFIWLWGIYWIYLKTVALNICQISPMDIMHIWTTMMR